MIARPSTKRCRGSGRRCGRGGAEGHAEEPSRAFQNRFPRPRQSLLCMGVGRSTARQQGEEHVGFDELSTIVARVRARSWARKRAAPQTARARNALLHPAKTQKKSPKPVLRIQFSLVFSGLFLWGHRWMVSCQHLQLHRFFLNRKMNCAYTLFGAFAHFLRHKKGPLHESVRDALPFCGLTAG